MLLRQQPMSSILGLGCCVWTCLLSALAHPRPIAQKEALARPVRERKLVLRARARHPVELRSRQPPLTERLRREPQPLLQPRHRSAAERRRFHLPPARPPAQIQVTSLRNSVLGMSFRWSLSFCLRRLQRGQSSLTLPSLH